MGSVKTISIIVAANIKGLENGLGKANKSLAKFASGAARMGSLMSFGITAPLTALGKSAFDAFSTFENSMMKVNAVTSASVSEFKMLTDEAKRLGSTTQFTAQQVAELQLVLGRKGFDPTQIKGMEQAILDLALATGEDLSLAADVVASSINAFGKDASDAASVANTLASAAANSSIQLGTFSTAFGHAGASASAVGVDIEELSAMMGVLMDNGIKASKAGTGLRTAFSKLNEEGVPFKETLDKLASGQMTLNDATALVGRTGANQLLILAKNRNKVKELTNEYKTNTGELARMAKLMGSTAKAKVALMSSAIEGMKIEVGALLYEAITPIIKGITDLATKFTNLSTKTKQNIIIFGGIAAAIGPVLLIVAGLTTLYGTLGIVIGALTSPIGLAIAAIIAIPIALKYVLDNWDAFAERLGDWSWWKNAIIQVLQWLVEYNPFNLILEGAQKLYDFLGVESKVFNPFDGLVDSLEGLKDETKEYKTEFGSLMDSIKDGIDGLGIDLDSFNIFGGSGGGSIEPVKFPVIPEIDFSAIRDLEDYLDEENFEVVVTPKVKIEGIADGMEKVSSSIIKFADQWEAAINGVFDVISMRLDNQRATVDNDHQKELRNIEQSSMSESQKATAMENLDENTANKLSKIKRKQAKADKMQALFNITLSTAEAVMAAAPNPYAMIAMGVLGAAQTALVMSQPIPAFAQGGLVTGATMGLVGEGRGTTMSNPEVIAPLDKLKGMLGDSGGNSYIPNVTISGDDLLIVFDRANRRKDRR